MALLLATSLPLLCQGGWFGSFLLLPAPGVWSSFFGGGILERGIHIIDLTNLIQYITLPIHLIFHCMITVGVGDGSGGV